MENKRPDTLASETVSPALNIALVGGGKLCIELLEKTTVDQSTGKINARILAVADPDLQAPCTVLARKQGLKTVSDYRELFNPELNIHLIIVLVDDETIFSDILNSRPDNIRILSYAVFDLFWKAIGREERKLRERNREVEAIFHGIQDSILVITPEKEIVDVNEAFLKNMGYTRDEVIGRKCHQVFQKASQLCSRDTVLCPLQTVLRNKTTSQSVMTRVNRKGELRYIEITIFPIWKGDGRISEFIEISRDITDRKLEEEEITRRLERLVAERTRQLKATHDQLLHQDKMASLGKLAASVVHEINNPNAGILNLIMLMKRIIREGPVEAGEMRQFNRYLELMETENRRISRIVSNLLTFSRQSQILPKDLALNPLIEKTLLLNDNLLKINGVRVEKHFDSHLPTFNGSEDHLQQVFMNLVSNAAEAMNAREDAVLTISTQYNPDAQTIRISFEDNGVGIFEENIPHLFEPFYTTKKKGKGVGLGLSVAYGIIQEHEGAIRVVSNTGKGATFTVELPLKKPSDTK